MPYWTDHTEINISKDEDMEWEFGPWKISANLVPLDTGN